MRKIQNILKTSVVVLLLTTGVGCTYDTTVDNPYGGPIDLLNLFTGNLEKASTSPVDLIWNASDRVGVFAGETTNKCFTLVENMNTSALFAPEDEMEIAGPIERVYAYAPYNEEATVIDNTLSINIPDVQPYQEGGTAPGMNPLVASSTTRSLFFKHLCGVVKLKIASPEFGTVKKVTLTTAAEDLLCGPASVDLGFDLYDDPQLTLEENAYKEVVLDCSADPIEITMAGRFFHFVVAPGTYETMVFTIENTDGEIFESRTKKPITVTRGQIADAGLALIYIEEFFYGKANCIQHDEPGTYTFDCAPYFTTDSYGYAYEFNTRDDLVLASTADLLWQSEQSMITALELAADKKSITFTAAKAGNALVAIRDAAGEILWSFHLWIYPVEEVLYPNGWYVFDRNLGARDNIKGEMGCWGLYYQWGRKDPMPELVKNDKDNNGIFDKNDNYASATYYKMDNSNFRITNTPSAPGVDHYYAVKHPTTFISKTGTTNVDWVWEGGNDRLWGNPEGKSKPKIENIKKSIYDPCPEGYMVSPLNLLTANGVKTQSVENFPIHGTFQQVGSDAGRMLTTNGINQWFPCARQYHNNMNVAVNPQNNATGFVDQIVRIWTSAPKSDNANNRQAYGFVFGLKPDATYPEWNVHRAFGYNIRCVKVVAPAESE